MTPRRSKLDWYKSLRGADLTLAEAYVLVLLVGYSDASMENAYPGVARLAEDSKIDKRRVQRILKSLVAKKAIEVTQEGGNQVRKGAATVYRILTPPQRSKGGAHATLQDDDKGGISSTKGGTTGQTRVAPMPPHQVINQVINHHRARARVRASGDPQTVDLESVLGQSSGIDDVKQDQKRLEEEQPRCAHPNCGVIEANHEQWLSMGDNNDRHPFEAKKATRA
jgi:hypothetical protein